MPSVGRATTTPEVPESDSLSETRTNQQFCDAMMASASDSARVGLSPASEKDAAVRRIFPTSPLSLGLAAATFTCNRSPDRKFASSGDPAEDVDSMAFELRTERIAASWRASDSPSCSNPAGVSGT